MKKINEEFLKEYMSSHIMGSNQDYTLIDFYRMYAAFSVFSLEDLLNSPQNYYNFLMDNIHLIKTHNKSDITTIKRLIDVALQNIEIRVKKAVPKPQEDFANIVSELSPNKNASHILDVGAGMVPYSSILMSRQFEQTSTMDKALFLNDETLKNLDVNPIKEYFDEHTDISKYDIVVGKAPCSAIEHIVRACAIQGKPYFIELCDCALPARRPYVADWSGWQDILPEIDEYVKFYTNHTTFAFNLGDVSVEQAQRVIDKHIPPKIFKYASPYTSFVVSKEEIQIPDSRLWLQPDEIYEAPNSTSTTSPEDTSRTTHSPDDAEFLQMELFERS